MLTPRRSRRREAVGPPGRSCHTLHKRWGLPPHPGRLWRFPPEPETEKPRRSATSGAQIRGGAAGPVQSTLSRLSTRTQAPRARRLWGKVRTATTCRQLAERNSEPNGKQRTTHGRSPDQAGGDPQGSGAGAVKREENKSRRPAFSREPWQRRSQLRTENSPLRAGEEARPPRLRDRGPETHQVLRRFLPLPVSPRPRTTRPPRFSPSVRVSPPGHTPCRSLARPLLRGQDGTRGPPQPPAPSALDVESLSHLPQLH